MIITRHEVDTYWIRQYYEDIYNISLEKDPSNEIGGDYADLLIQMNESAVEQEQEP